MIPNGTPRAAAPRRRAPARVLLLLLALASLLSSCAYFNTFYLARKYYFRATDGKPYLVEGQGSAGLANFNKSIDYSKKLLANYPKSKWVDDAYLLWARSLLGKEDPLETVNMLTDFSGRYPSSPVAGDALFYTGVAYRRARKYTEAVTALENFTKAYPKHALVPYAYLERSFALVSLGRPADAAAAAGVILDKYPKSALTDRALAQRADALFAAKSYDAARADYRRMGARARTDDERFQFLLREVDCIESARDYDGALALLRDAISHEREPLPPDTTGGKPPTAPSGPGADRWGRLQTRIGTIHMLAGRVDDALRAYQSVIDDYPRSALAAEAQYRIGYTYETTADDFARARDAYAKVREQGGSQAFIAQAQQRLTNLDNLEKYRSTAVGGDSLSKRAEAAFLLAEQYLFQLDKPERAIQVYRAIADTMAGTPWAAKAMNAQAWVLSRKLDRKPAADSLFWRVVREYPATEAQLAARDYLEADGQTVPEDLIKLPEKPPPPPADSVALTPVPETPPLGVPPQGRFAPGDTLGASVRGMGTPGGVMFPSGSSATPRGAGAAAAGAGTAGADTAGAAAGAVIGVGGAHDTTHVPAPRDTTHVPAPRDTTHASAPAPASRDTAHAPAPAPPDTSKGRR